MRSAPDRPRESGSRTPPSPRTTRQLDATLRALCESRLHPTAEQVFRAVRRRLPTIGRATVYRNLQKLAADGRARVVAAAERSTRFDARTDRHDHFVCRMCGCVIDVEPELRRSRRSRRRVGAHRVDDVAMTYFGACAACDRGRAHSADERG